MPPPQWFVLGPAYLASLGVNVALKLWWRPPPQIRMKLLSPLNLFAILKPDFRPI